MDGIAVATDGMMETAMGAEPERGKPSGAAALLAQINEVLEQAGIYLAAEIDGATLVLSGEVDSAENRQAALDVASALAEPHGYTVDETIDVLAEAPDQVFDTNGGSGGRFAYIDPDRNDDTRLDAGFDGDPDFSADIGTLDSEEAAAEATPYFPPTDPVIRITADTDGIEVLGGFGATSMDETATESSSDIRNDDDITQAVRRHLAQDAMTTDLRIRVDTKNGIVRLRGVVETLDDAENAEAVAAQVGGVRDVIEELTIASLPGSGGES